MGKYVLGVDGGGTKTHVAVYDYENHKVTMLSWGPSNHEGMDGSYTELETVLKEMLDTALAKAGATWSEVEMSVLGLAGVDTREQDRIISAICHRIGIGNLVLSNDSFLGIKAGTEAGFGICAINGTGYSVTGIDPSGGRLQIGGIGDLSGDFGGGGALVPAAVGAVYDELFREHEKTALTPKLMKMLGVEDKFSFMDGISAKVYSNWREFILQGSKMLFETAGEGDKVALDILARSGQSYGEAICGIIRELNFPETEPVEVVLAGSQFTKGEHDHIIVTLSGIIAKRFPDRKIIYKKLHTPCVTGAVLWGLDELGIKGHREWVEAGVK